MQMLMTGFRILRPFDLAGKLVMRESPNDCARGVDLHQHVARGGGGIDVIVPTGKKQIFVREALDTERRGAGNAELGSVPGGVELPIRIEA